MKPRIFIGSSVEGLEIAYAIQQNLTYDADVTVWDQGVFELSRTTIESLTEVIENSDFGIFVFNPDDLLTIRETEVTTVRDNVIFEIGLFIGKLSRERVFFLKPMKGNLHIPTDLTGVTPGVYDSEREDGSLQAATGPFCNQVRKSIKKLNRISTKDDIPQNPDKEVSGIESDLWYLDFHKKEYDTALEKINELLKKKKSEEERHQLNLWKIYCEFKKSEKQGIQKFDAFLKKNSDKALIYTGVARIYHWEEYFEKSEEIITAGLKHFKKDSSLINLQADNIKQTRTSIEAIDFLKQFDYENSDDISSKLYNLYYDDKDYLEARDVIHKVYSKFPSKENIKFKYALVSIDLEDYEIALFLLDSLTKDFPENSSYWGYLSNAALMLNYYDLALSTARKAEDLTQSKQSWIVGNIGNIFSNKGFYSESISYFEKAIVLDKESDYAHDRLASTMKDKKIEIEKIASSCKEGRRKIRNYEEGQ